MSAADLRRITHERGDLVEAFAFYGQVAAEGMAILQTSPIEAVFLVYLPQVLGEVVRIPAFAGRRRKEPEAVVRRVVGRQNLMEGLADRHDPVLLSLWLPVFFIYGLGLNTYQAFVQIDILSPQPGTSLPPQPGVDVGGNHGMDSWIIFQYLKLLLDLFQFQKADLRNFDHIFVMDRDNLHDVIYLDDDDRYAHKVRLFRELDPEPEDYQVPDPYYGDGDGFSRVFEIVDRTSHELLRRLVEEHELS